MKTKLLLISLLIAISALQLFSSEDDVIRKSLPKMLGATNVGKDFWFTVPPCFEDESGEQDFIRIFVTSGVKNLVTVEVEGKGYFSSQNTVPNDIIMFNITPVQGQPFLKGGHDPNIPEQVFPGSGIHIYSDQPIVVYCVVEYHYTSDGWLCIPSSSAGSEYIVSGYKVDSMFNAIWGYKLPSMCGVVAPFNDTKVTFTMGGNTFSRTAGGMKPGNTKSFILQRGDVWMVSTDGDESDLSGSKITANKPIQIVTGMQCANIPTGNQWCDYCAEMEIPTMAWGTVMHVPQISKKSYPSLIRIYAKQPNTDIFRDSLKIGHLSASGGVEGEAFLETRLVPIDNKPRSVVISGSKPINIMLMNTGTEEDANRSYGDPFFMNILPVESYQKEITFCTPSFHSQFGFIENIIALIYETNSDRLMPDDMEFGSVSYGVVHWSKLNKVFPGTDEIFYPVKEKYYAHKLIKLTKDGVYKIRAEKPFAAYLYGFGDFDSYGYPASAMISDFNIPDTVPPNPIFTINCDGSVTKGIIEDMPEDIKYRSNLSTMNMDASTSYNYLFDFDPIIPGSARTTQWSLSVIDQSREARAVITFSDRCGNDTTIIIHYSPTILTINEEMWDFGKIKLHSAPAKHDFIVINESLNSTPLLIEINLKDTGQYFTLDLGKNVLPMYLQPMDSIRFSVIFNPEKIGEFSDSTGVSDTCSSWFRGYVHAKVIDPVINVSNVDFGTLSKINDSITNEFSISNSGSTDLHITHIKGPWFSSIFSTDLPKNLSVSNPLSLAPQELRKYNITFKPEFMILYSDSIIFSSDADNMDSVCYINGFYTSVKDNKNKDEYLNISTNPVNWNLKYEFRYEKPGYTDIQIIDINGKTVQNAGTIYFKGEEQYGYINLSEFLNGIYFLRLDCSGKVLTAKFSVVK